jgi:F0F1-type ATP synthase membrane subunit c/vacuolar-type H+-ATPase subunit K
VNELKARLTRLRLFQLAMIVSIPLFGRVAEIGGDPGSNSWTMWHWLVVGVVLWAIFGVSSIRSRILTRSQQALAKDASDLKALKQWDVGHIIGMAFAENIAMWGLVVRMVLGGALWQALLFYIASLILLLIWTPRLPKDFASN